MIIADAIFSDLDSSAHLQNFPCGSLDKTTRIPTKYTWISRFLDGLAPWDSVYFVRIAKCGYETDMMNAFFPFLPFLMRYGAKYTGLAFIGTQFMNIPIESIYTALGLEVNIAAFCIAAVALHRLGNSVLQNEELASLSVLLFCCNPASVFYSAAYTEALFAAFTWTGLVLLTFKSRESKGGGNFMYWAVGVLIFAVAGATRSNGILSAWFLIHPLLIETYTSLHSRKKACFPWKALLQTTVGCAVVWSPYCAMQGKTR
jgi:phosphatidylinositol glycan class V